MAARMQMLLLLTLLCGLSAAKHLGDLEAGGGAVGGLHHHQHHQHSASTHHRRRLQRDSRAKDATSASLGTAHQCEAVKSYFESIDIKSSGFHNEKEEAARPLYSSWRRGKHWEIPFSQPISKIRCSFYSDSSGNPNLKGPHYMLRKNELNLSQVLRLFGSSPKGGSSGEPPDADIQVESREGKGIRFPVGSRTEKPQIGKVEITKKESQDTSTEDIFQPSTAVASVDHKTPKALDKSSEDGRDELEKLKDENSDTTEVIASAQIGQDNDNISNDVMGSKSNPPEVSKSKGDKSSGGKPPGDKSSGEKPPALVPTQSPTGPTPPSRTSGQPPTGPTSPTGPNPPSRSAGQPPKGPTQPTGPTPPSRAAGQPPTGPTPPTGPQLPSRFAGATNQPPSGPIPPSGPKSASGPTPPSKSAEVPTKPASPIPTEIPTNKSSAKQPPAPPSKPTGPSSNPTGNKPPAQGPPAKGIPTNKPPAGAKPPPKEPAPAKPPTGKTPPPKAPAPGQPPAGKAPPPKGPPPDKPPTGKTPPPKEPPPSKPPTGKTPPPKGPPPSKPPTGNTPPTKSGGQGPGKGGAGDKSSGGQSGDKNRVVTLMPGDGIGPEIAMAVIQVLEAAGAPLIFEPVDVTPVINDEGQTTIPEEVIESMNRTKVGLKGPLMTPVGSGFRSLNLTMRQMFNLYANVRPCKSLPGTERLYGDVDIVTIRENTEGEYSGIEHTLVNGVVQSIKLITRAASLRVAEYAFQYALAMKRKKVTVVAEKHVMRMSDGLFLRCVQEMAAKYKSKLDEAGIEFEEVNMTTLCLKLVIDPSRYDMLVLPNLYGDIISDTCAGLIGGLGLTPSGNVGEHGAIFESVHGTAPDIAGKDVANPTALLLSSVMMLHYIGLHEHADKVEQAVIKTIRDDKIRTVDLRGTAKCSEYTNAVIKNLN